MIDACLHTEYRILFRVFDCVTLFSTVAQGYQLLLLGFLAKQELAVAAAGWS